MRLPLRFLSGFGLMVALSSCASDHSSSAQSAVARNFDELAGAVASCAAELRRCGDEDAGWSDREACQKEFLSCRADAGKASQSSLADEISDCQERANACRADAGSDGDETKCRNSLRACIGEAHDKDEPDAGDPAAPNPHPPTYQCFGQLRECVADGGAAKTCAEKARTCIIAAVGDPPALGRPPVTPPPAAGAPEAGRGNPGGMAGAAGGGGKDHAPGAGGAGGKPSGGAGGAGGKPAGGTGGQPAGGTGGAGGAASDDDSLTRMCASEREACLAGGEKQMTCDREQRMCLKRKP